MPRYVSASVPGCGLGFLSKLQCPKGSRDRGLHEDEGVQNSWKWRGTAWQGVCEQILFGLGHVEGISPCLSYCLILCLIFACTRGLAASHYTIAFICFPSDLCLTYCSLLEYEITLLIGVWGWGLVGWRRGRKGCWTWPEHQQWQQMVTNVLSDCH